MGIMKIAAIRGIIPAGSKVKELRQNIFNLMVRTPEVLEEILGQDGLDALVEVFHRLGMEEAEALKDRLGLGNTLKESADAWMIIGHVLGSKMSSDWVSETRVEFHHQYCPQYESFQKAGSYYCSTVCLPYMASIASGVWSSVRMEVVRPADEKEPCIKALTTNQN